MISKFKKKLYFIIWLDLLMPRD